MWSKVGILTVLLFFLLAGTGLSQMSIPEYVAGQELTGSVSFTMTGPIPDDSSLEAYLGEDPASSLELKPYLDLLKPYSYPVRDFEYTISASGGSATRSGSCSYLQGFSASYNKSELDAMLGITGGSDYSLTLEPGQDLQGSISHSNGSYTITVYTDSDDFAFPVNLTVYFTDLGITVPSSGGNLTIRARRGLDVYFSETRKFSVCPDADSDGYGPGCSPGDCNDNNASIHPGAYDMPANGVDENCDSFDGIVDLDNDGYENTYPNGTVLDCDDSDASVNPGVSENCNQVDDNCDSVVDNVNNGNSTESTKCRCYDSGPRMESCNSIDDDCDQEVDENLLRLCSADNQGECAVGNQECILGVWTGCQEPSAEICDGLDNDCDGSVDEGVKLACTNYETCGSYEACACPAEPVEVCNSRDDDCDGQIDEDCGADETPASCSYGPIPSTGCTCDDAVYNMGYCCAGRHSMDPCGSEVPLWAWLAAVIIIIIIIAVIWFLLGR